MRQKDTRKGFMLVEGLSEVASEVLEAKIGWCRLCKEKNELRRSHAIPDAIFRRLFKGGDGKAIHLPVTEGALIQYTSDSWWEYQLCSGCEQFLNEAYDEYGISLLRGRRGRLIKHERGVSFQDVDVGRFRLFILSVLWRAAANSSPAYDKVVLPYEIADWLRGIVVHGTHAPLRHLAVEMHRLIDYTETGFTQEALKALIISPFRRKHPERKVSFCFLMEGFFVEVFFPGHRFKDRQRKGVLHVNSRTIHSPFMDIFSIPEIKRALSIGYMKAQEGMVHPSVERNS